MRPPSLYQRLAAREVYHNPWVVVEVHEIVHPTGAAGEHVLIAAGRASGVLVIDGDNFVLAPTMARPHLSARSVNCARSLGSRRSGGRRSARCTRFLRSSDIR
jgi:hypothetical protein